MIKFFSLLFILISFFSCQIFDSPKNKLVQEFYDSNQSKKVILFERSGNATVNNSIHISLEGYDYELNDNDGGNIFIGDQLERNERKEINVKWLNDSVVVINYPQGIRIFKKEDRFDDNLVGTVIINYNESAIKEQIYMN